ncbi:MAG: porin family protein [Alphaproteobacteria bacterium]|nr:porin family protein [Alphaproteobacteria bacterium]
MKKIIGILLASSVLSSAAFANAAPSACPACPSAPAAKWGGFKLGAQLGYGHSSVRLVNSDISAKGVIGGLHAGYDYQVSNSVVLGLNTSFDLSGVKGNPTTGDKLSNKWTVAVVPQVGLVLQDSKLYAGAGWAATKMQFKDTTAPAFSKSKTLNAFRLQMGAAQRMNKVLVGLEANYDFYGKKALTNYTNTSAKPRTLSAMVKVSYMM